MAVPLKPSLTKIQSAKLVYFLATLASFSSHDQMFTLFGFIAVCPRGRLQQK